MRVTQAIVTIEGKRGETASFLTKRETIERERERRRARKKSAEECGAQRC